MSVTIKDVARAAQVSVATVSRTLNGHGNVAEEVRRRVLAVAQDLRYTPHAAARSLSSRRTHTLGVVLPDLHGEFFSELVRGVDQVAREHRLHLLVSSYHGRPEEQAAALRAMRGRVDGLLVMSPYVAAQAPIVDELDAAMPIVLINTQSAVPGLLSLSVDNYGGARAMVEHLVDCGHRRIAFIAGPEDNFDAHERLRGYREALARLLPDASEWVLPGQFDEASGHRAGQALLAAPQRPDAVFAANDMMALGCLFSFVQAGLKVPDDIAVAGFDDIPLARYVHPTLTTMRVNIAELGARAARLLLTQLGTEAAAQEQQPSMDEPRQSEPLRPELIVRESGVRRGGGG
ncbi:bacterial regulatory s, lacI family protein [Lysobacter antibioticus]|jgi:LacI family transcriptional regulator|uniref:Periplasmic binding and sugar binding domain of LacI family protein n=1 Tax=Lysobacter antibioticus TaxID=84531 RepID=A0A0S2DV62_LYSAN|nr:LacI family DNA-binding transcriptional regulator [Lysobacter antibioticus]ALN62088.1 bacterial regulatory s, lacI family protein [Lysobacter antibioticus]ALN80570.1 periplasmic binding and sugar binding domain of LacI family protein [Lysobacter antibioticus]